MKIVFYLIISLVLLLCHATAQSSSLTTGGDFVGERGSISISVGEPFCSISTNDKDLLNFFQLGVQQTRNLEVVSVEKPQDDKFAVYPNPTREQLHVSLSGLSSKSESISYVVYSSDGKKCLTGNLLNNDINEIDVQQLSSGQYILKLDTPQNHLAHFIKCD